MLSFKRDFAIKGRELDYVLAALFLIFIVFQFEIPPTLASYIDTPFGMAVVMIGAIYLFFYTTPILGVLSLIAAYEILRRSARQTGNYALKYLPTQQSRDRTLTAMNTGVAAPPAGSGETLEEQVVSKMAPIGVAAPGGDEYIETAFKPVVEGAHGAVPI